MIQFWFEFASTYSYLAAMRVEQVAAGALVPVEWRPFLLGPLFQKQGWNDSPYNLNPARGRYMWRDIERHCLHYGLTFRKPSVFPRRSILPARVACLGHGKAWLPEFARSVFRANFGDDLDIEDPALLRALLVQAGAARGEAEAAAILERATAQETKDLLRSETDRAWTLGLFGAPTFIVEGELFWGNDRLEEALEWHASHAGRG